MHATRLPLAFSIGGWLCLIGTSALQSLDAVGNESFRSVQKASCGPKDRPESVQGQTTLAERFSPGPPSAYHCNLELVGRFQGEGAGFALQVLDTCAYYATVPNPKMRHTGVVVLDVSDSKRPKATAYLDSPAMLNPVESLSVEPTRKLLLANQAVSATATPFDTYDLSGDCRHPVLRGSVVLSRVMTHVGAFTRDGQSYFGTSWDIPPLTAGATPDPAIPPGSAVFAIDTTDPSSLKTMSTWIPPEPWKTHSVNVNQDGTRAFVAISWRPQTSQGIEPHGLAIVDISDFQSRQAHPKFRLVSTHFWDDTHEAQFVLPVTIRNKNYLIFSDLGGSIGYKHPAPEEACSAGKPTYGFPRIIDIQNEKSPKTVSKLMLEVADPARCSEIRLDPTTVYGYGCMGCDVDSTQDARLLACSFFEGGLRVFDIREPRAPREVAYYKPPAARSTSLPGSALRTWGAKDITADPVTVPRFRKNGREIWFISSDNGFQVVSFTEEFRADNKGLFRH